MLEGSLNPAWFAGTRTPLEGVDAVLVLAGEHHHRPPEASVSTHLLLWSFNDHTSRHARQRRVKASRTRRDKRGQTGTEGAHGSSELGPGRPRRRQPSWGTMCQQVDPFVTPLQVCPVGSFLSPRASVGETMVPQWRLVVPQRPSYRKPDLRAVSHHSELTPYDVDLICGVLLILPGLWSFK